MPLTIWRKEEDLETDNANKEFGKREGRHV